MKIGILTGGGDAPGINAVIRAIVRKAIQNYGYETFGIKDGWLGLVQGEFTPLDIKNLSGLLPKGGTILGTSRTNPFKSADGPSRILKNVSEQGIEAVIAIGGDDTLGVACQTIRNGASRCRRPQNNRQRPVLALTTPLVSKRQFQLLVKHLTDFVQRQNRITGS